MRIENLHEMETLILKTEVKPQKGKITKEEYSDLWSGATEKAKQTWEQLIEKNKKFYEKDKYLDIEYLADKKQYRRVPLSKGRPKEEKTKDKRVTVRLDIELQEILNNYCQTKNITESEAIRQAILKLKYKY